MKVSHGGTVLCAQCPIITNWSQTLLQWGSSKTSMPFCQTQLFWLHGRCISMQMPGNTKALAKHATKWCQIEPSLLLIYLLYLVYLLYHSGHLVGDAEDVGGDIADAEAGEDGDLHHVARLTRLHPRRLQGADSLL